MDNGNLKSRKNLIVSLIVLVIIILGLTITIVALNLTSTPANNSQDSQTSNDDANPTLSESETIYNNLEILLSDPSSLQEKSVALCNDKYGSAEDVNAKFNITTSCALFLTDNNYPDSTITLLDNLSRDELSESQLIILYDYYKTAYDKLGDTAKAQEYQNERQKLLETRKEERREQ